jgi:hypothetical protein
MRFRSDAAGVQCWRGRCSQRRGAIREHEQIIWWRNNGNPRNREAMMSEPRPYAPAETLAGAA